jgi:uncharacterized membrane protein
MGGSFLVYWVYILTFFILVAVIVAVIVYIMNKIRKKQRERAEKSYEEILEELHDQFIFLKRREVDEEQFDTGKPIEEAELDKAQS